MRIIGGHFRGKKILPVPSKETRPTADRTREMVFNVLMHNPAFGPAVVAKKVVLDVFAGTGALGLEALSRGAKSATFVENSRESLRILRKNIAAFSDVTTHVIEQDAQALGAAQNAYELIFLDPPYGKGLVAPTLSRLVAQGWVASQAVVVIEVDSSETLDLSPFLSVVTERLSGRAKIIFATVERND